MPNELVSLNMIADAVRSGVRNFHPHAKIYRISLGEVTVMVSAEAANSHEPLFAHVWNEQITRNAKGETRGLRFTGNGQFLVIDREAWGF